MAETIFWSSRSMVSRCSAAFLWPGVLKMHYLQIGITIVLVLGIIAALFYSLTITIWLVSHQIDKREAMRKTFISFFLAFMSIFLTVIIWQDKTNWNFSIWVSFLVLAIGVSFFIALFFALMYWNWKK